MDSSIISILVAVLIGGVITMAEKWINRPPSGRAAAQPKQPAQPLQAQPQAFAQAQAAPARAPKRAKPQCKPKAEATPAPRETLFTEGERVTADTPPLSDDIGQQPSKLPPMPGSDLRSAIIWGEILRRKF